MITTQGTAANRLKILCEWIILILKVDTQQINDLLFPAESSGNGMLVVTNGGINR